MILEELTIKDEISTDALRIAQAYDIMSKVSGVERTRIVAITTSYFTTKILYLSFELFCTYKLISGSSVVRNTNVCRYKKNNTVIPSI